MNACCRFVIHQILCCEVSLIVVVLTDEEPGMLSTIKKLNYRLADFIKPDLGLLDELLVLEVLSRRQYDDIMDNSDNTVFEQNDTLLDLLTLEDQCVKFIKALERTGQHHVVNYIRRNKGQRNSDVIIYHSDKAHGYSQSHVCSSASFEVLNGLQGV